MKCSYLIREYIGCVQMNSKKSDVYYTSEQMKRMLDVDRKYKTKMFITNCLFDDLVNCEEFRPKISNVKCKTGEVRTTKKQANANHIAFAFSFVYLVSYLYRFAKYIHYGDDGQQIFIDEEILYKMCNTSPASRGKNGVSYITKKNGLLERLGYTRKVKEYPVEFSYVDGSDEPIEDFTKEKINGVKFWLNTYFTPQNGYDMVDYPNKTINFPVRAFYYDKQSEEENYLNGYFHFPHGTTQIDIDVFIKCMSTKELGTVGFYLYSFLKSKCDFFGGQYIRAISDFAKDIGIGSTKLVESLKSLEEYNMITNSHNFFVPNLPDGKHLPANRYTVIDSEKFLYSKQKIKKRKVISAMTYAAIGGLYLGEEETSVVKICEVDLPF